MTSLSPFSIALPPVRAALPGDAAAIAHVHVRAWHETYTGLLPAARVAARTEADRTLQWRELLSHGRNAPAVFLAVPGGEVAGFVCLGPQRSTRLQALGFDHEVSALYLLASAQGCGFGRALMSVAAHRLLDRRGRGLALWALATNKHACGFYEALHGTTVAERIDGDGAQRAFGWDDPAVLL